MAKRSELLAFHQVALEDYLASSDALARLRVERGTPGDVPILLDQDDQELAAIAQRCQTAYARLQRTHDALWG